MFLKKKDILTSKKVILTSIIGNDKIYNWIYILDEFEFYLSDFKYEVSL